jgi:hypothetical protein
MKRDQIERELKAYRLGWLRPNAERERELAQELQQLDESDERRRVAQTASDRETLNALRRALRRPRKPLTPREAVDESIRAYDAGDLEGSIRALQVGLISTLRQDR